ncbi:MAG TPA: DUF1707 domain-containing protein [Mycobacteriales bacterium]|nr:DUF1707 domain-containing protein [Mycobacteriales bacterium]
MSEPEQIRASNAEREAAIARLNDACSEGRLTLDEFSERVERAWGARTRGDLEQLTSDLPMTSATAPAPTSAPATQWHVSPIGGFKRRGRWKLAESTTAVTLIGGMNLDLAEAELSANEVTLTAVSLVGGVSLRVPPGVRIVPTGFSLLGGRRIDLDDPDPGAPTVRVRLFSLIGGISARSSRPLDRWRKALRGRAF